MQRRVANFLDDTDFDELGSSQYEYDIEGQEQAEKLINSMYHCPTVTVLDVPDTKSYIEQTQSNDVTDSITDELICRAYTAAKQALNVSDRIMSNSLNMSISHYRNLLNTKPQFAMAVQCGIMDGQQERYDDLTQSLYKLATGRFIVEEVKTESQDVINALGNKIGTATKTTTTRKRVPPDAKTAQKLLARMDPSWKQDAKEVDVNIKLAQELKVTEDVTMAVDPTTLPPNILEYLITSNTKGIEGEKVVGGYSDAVLSAVDEQSSLHKTLKQLNEELSEILPEKQEDTVVDKETLDALTKPKKKRGRPKKTSAKGVIK